MNITFSKFLSFGLIILIGLSSCEKESVDTDADDLKNETGFYFTAKIDGQDFVADMKSCECSTPADFLTETYKHNNNLYIRAKKNTANANEGEFFLSLGSVSTPYSGAGVYELVPEEGVYAGVSYTLNSEKWAVGDASLGAKSGQLIYSPTTGTVTITKDENKVVEGTFSFDVYNEALQSTKKITEGKFRLQL